ncbi:cytochrome P450 [Phaeosphaeria sp. MPI-PUGE-AT-0046c]|nr:cytochrome P450 [Phaeosphaeria sp. MPI-PUGE-AT-0046c]
MIVAAIVGSLVLYITWSLVCLEINYQRAVSMGIPLVRLPIDPLNIFFQVFESHAWKVIDQLPVASLLPTWTHYARRGWYFKDKATSHIRYGPIWALVTPRDIHILICEPQAVHEVFARRNDFIRPIKMYSLLEVYGPTISTADQANWPRHRKVLATPFNEGAMSFVWDESLRQTRYLTNDWAKREGDKVGFSSVSVDTRTLSLNVMAACGFRRSFDFKSSSEEEGTKGTYSYRDSLQIVLDNVILIMLIPRRHLNYSWLPRNLRVLGKAAADFKVHMTRMLEEETSMMKRGEKGSGSLMTSFVRALDTHQKDNIEATTTKGLSVDEIFGNIFVINFAGHDTTANTLAFTMILLAANPDVQDWVREDILRVTEGLDVADWHYEKLFPQLTRCRAILHETLRLYPPILALPKWTNEAPTSLRIGGRTVVIPPFSGISPTVLASHTHPDYWPEPLSWKPSRWVVSDSTDTGETLSVPEHGKFYPWSEGPQNCLGVKFSQVEFVAVVACLLRNSRLSIVPNAGESPDDTLKRVRDVTEDCDFQMLLRMKHPEKIRLYCHAVE